MLFLNTYPVTSTETTSATTAIDSLNAGSTATYVVQLRGGPQNLTKDDINFLHFTSGYAALASSTSGSTLAACPSSEVPNTVNGCLAQKMSYTTPIAADVGIFAYAGGHMEMHASLDTANPNLGNLSLADLTAAVFSTINVATNLKYVQPLMSGGLSGAAVDYRPILQGIVSGELLMKGALGMAPVCTRYGALYHGVPCVAGGSPVNQAWHYSIGHWVEDDPLGDGAYSSIGAQGYYPWIEANKIYWGQISSGGNPSTNYSTLCGKAIRKAWDTGVAQ